MSPGRATNKQKLGTLPLSRRFFHALWADHFPLSTSKIANTDPLENSLFCFLQILILVKTKLTVSLRASNKMHHVKAHYKTN